MKQGLKITETAAGPVQILHLQGYLDGHTFVELERKVEALLKVGKTRLVIELSALSYIASAGVGVFINSQHQAKTKGGTVQLVNPSASVREIFSILGLASIFTIHDTIDQGVKAASA
ncbi:MAG: STAS domain-containing protein [Planctomycetota bacterium]